MFSKKGEKQVNLKNKNKNVEKRDREKFKIQTLVNNGLNIEQRIDQNGIFSGVNQDDIQESFFTMDHSFDINSGKICSGDSEPQISSKSGKDNTANLK